MTSAPPVRRRPAPLRATVRRTTGLSPHLVRVNGDRGAELERAVLGHPRTPGRGQVWVATEAGVVRGIRRGLLAYLDRDQLTTRGYWRAGESNHPDHHYGDDA